MNSDPKNLAAELLPEVLESFKGRELSMYCANTYDLTAAQQKAVHATMPKGSAANCKLNLTLDTTFALRAILRSMVA